MEKTELLTIRDIAGRLGVPLFRVRYVIDQYNIEPDQRAGFVRLWFPESLPRIKSALDRVASRRSAR